MYERRDALRAGTLTRANLRSRRRLELLLGGSITVVIGAALQQRELIGGPQTSRRDAQKWES